MRGSLAQGVAPLGCDRLRQHGAYPLHVIRRLAVPLLLDDVVVVGPELNLKPCGALSAAVSLVEKMGELLVFGITGKTKRKKGVRPVGESLRSGQLHQLAVVHADG